MLPIAACVGPNGAGKTLAAIERAVLPSWERGRPVVSNVQLVPAAAGYSPDLYRPLESWTQIPELSGCLLLLDEISRVLPSRQHASAPAQLVGVLNQLRKVDVALVWTAPNWQRCDVMLREVTQSVTVCRGLFPDRFVREPRTGKRFPKAMRDEDGKRLRIDSDWLPNRVMRWVTYDAMLFDEFTYARVEDVRPIGRRWYWRSRHVAQECYRTLDAVDLLDHLDDVGTCMACGGHRTRPKCTCVRPNRRELVELPEAAERALAVVRPPLPPVENRPRFGPVKAKP